MADDSATIVLVTGLVTIGGSVAVTMLNHYLQRATDAEKELRVCIGKAFEYLNDSIEWSRASARYSTFINSEVPGKSPLPKLAALIAMEFDNLDADFAAFKEAVDALHSWALAEGVRLLEARKTDPDERPNYTAYKEYFSPVRTQSAALHRALTEEARKQKRKRTRLLPG
jgi:hypothetical protein